eukprot:1156698-Pelagomonas_calceolata.AAC.3
MGEGLVGEGEGRGADLAGEDTGTTLAAAAAVVLVGVVPVEGHQVAGGPGRSRTSEGRFHRSGRLAAGLPLEHLAAQMELPKMAALGGHGHLGSRAAAAQRCLQAALAAALRSILQNHMSNVPQPLSSRRPRAVRALPRLNRTPSRLKARSHNLFTQQHQPHRPSCREGQAQQESDRHQTRGSGATREGRRQTTGTGTTGKGQAPKKRLRCHKRGKAPNERHRHNRNGTGTKQERIEHNRTGSGTTGKGQARAQGRTPQQLHYRTAA